MLSGQTSRNSAATMFHKKTGLPRQLAKEVFFINYNKVENGLPERQGF
jgi:hypothetical protein